MNTLRLARARLKITLIQGQDYGFQIAGRSSLCRPRSDLRVTPPRFAFGICVSDPPHLRKICARKLGAASTKSYRSNVRKRQNAKILPENLRLDIASRLEFSLMRREFDRRKENPTFHCVKYEIFEKFRRKLAKFPQGVTKSQQKSSDIFSTKSDPPICAQFAQLHRPPICAWHLRANLI